MVFIKIGNGFIGFERWFHWKKVGLSGLGFGLVLSGLGSELVFLNRIWMDQWSFFGLVIKYDQQLFKIRSLETIS